jgi:uncharacterized protein (TIGR03437 family)
MLILQRPANNGTFVGVRPTPQVQLAYTLTRWRPGESNIDLLSAAEIQGVSLSANGNAAAVLTEQPDFSVQLQWVDVETGNTQVFLSLPPVGYGGLGGVFTSISDDGNHAGATPQVYVWDRNNGVTTTLAGLLEGAVAATISRNGGFAWVGTKTNRLVRVNLDSGSFEEVLSAFPISLRVYGSVPVPGSAVRLDGSAPIVGEHFQSGSVELPILPGDQSASTLVQVPWEFSAELPAQGTAPLPLVLRKDGYPFELSLSFDATDQVTPVPQQSLSGNFIVKATPTDFSYLIDAAHPAIAGSTIVVWMTGLGPLDRPVATGVPGPANPPAHPLAHLECGLASNIGQGPAWRGLELPFIGYAPGLVGVYQVNVKIPADRPTNTSYLDCYSGGQISWLYLPVAAAP